MHISPRDTGDDGMRPRVILGNEEPLLHVKTSDARPLIPLAMLVYVNHYAGSVF